VHIEIDSLELMPSSVIAEADVRRCGEKTGSHCVSAQHAGPIADDTLLYRWSSTSSGTNRAELDVMTERGAAAVAPEPGRDSRPFAGSGMKSDDVGRIMGAQCEHVVALRPRPTGDG
jgi:hypothetical protein